MKLKCHGEKNGLDGVWKFGFRRHITLRRIPAQQTLVITCTDLHSSSNGFYWDFIAELSYKRQKCSEHFLVIYDIVTKPLLPYMETLLLSSIYSPVNTHTGRRGEIPQERKSSLNT
jgi:hypothetical protein